MQQILHSSIPADFLDYLVSSGFRFERTGPFTGYFDRENIRVAITFLKVEVQHFKTGVILSRHHEFTDIHKLDFTAWVMLLDIMGAMPIGELTGSISRKELSTVLSTVARRKYWPSELETELIPTLELQEQVF